VSSNTSATETTHQVAIGQIKTNQHQPRQFFDDEKLQELAASIKKNGILQPLIVEKQGLSYHLVAGERRLRAAQMAGLSEVPIIVHEFSSEQRLEVALIENIQREDLKPIEQAKAYEQLIKQAGLSHEELAMRLGKSRSAITNSLRLLHLPNDVQVSVESGKVSAGHARALLSLESRPDLQQKLHESIVKEEISVRETEQRAKELASTPANRKSLSKGVRSQNIVKTEKHLMENLGVKLQIKGDENRGTIAIRYHSQEKLNHIIALLKQSQGNE
jgi:ParB family transcriptional regulator, chromosome partitioning protein